MNRRPACEEAETAATAIATGSPLVQIGLPTGTRSTGFEASRRDVLSLMGFSLGALGLGSGCRAPVQHAVPLPAASTEMVPGVPNLYATTCGACSASCGLVVKQRDGRPIKIEGNDASPLTRGGTCAAGQASVLSLYDDARLRGPVWLGNPVSWEEIDRHIKTMLNAGSGDPRAVVLLSQTITSPSALAVLNDFRVAFPSFRHVVYDPMSLAALREANRLAHGAAVVPHFRFDRARVVVGLEADFLGTWLAPVEFARQWSRRRTADGERAFHVQCESGMSVTGSNADLRLAIAPSELGPFAVALLAAVARRVSDDGLAGLRGAGLAPDAPHAAAIDRIADALARHRGEALVVTGSNDVATQLVVAKLNALLGGVGKTVDLEQPSLQRQGDDAQVADLIQQMNRGAVRALIVWGANPVYDHPDGVAFTAALKKVPLTISLADRRDETGAHVRALCPDHHFLESWGDAEPVRGQFSLRQPLIAPLHDTRSGVESLLVWAGRPTDHRTRLRDFWQRELHPRALGAGPFEGFWERSLERGVVEMPQPAVAVHAFAGDWQGAVRDIVTRGGRPPTEAYELALQETVGARDGRHANNPWLQELPDPITRLTWGNVACIAPATAAAQGITTGDVVTLTTEVGKLELPAFVQPGQERRTISVAIGYGRWAAGKAGDGVGGNVFPLVRVENGLRRASAPVTLSKTGRRARLAPAQTHFSMEGRDIVQTMALGQDKHEAEHEHEHEALPNLWRERLHGAHAWGMSIDLDACTGCSACVVACQAENNVPVVGAEQVRKSRIMHWMRIDRYLEGDGEDVISHHQPMMCQHCQHAPCETVCPVLATTTSSEGINQQVYNRCIGTRYCANNCPYKVRRFNWHNFTANDDFPFNMTSPLGRLVLNPDVTVRSRGVMEKCNLCVQRIQLAKNQALLQRRPMADGDVATACQQACPTGAIVFGDLADAQSRVSKLLAGRRAYRVLEDLGTRPNVGYLKKITSKETT
ncbi:MAG TPA: 4Fe-4S dicluster domain-containing protein [Polyangia bacterium]|nr:4Fe-4S dicluster domain-containing protein [Polyangia bacterium]